ncbi:MAG: hypothetical protein LBH14_04485, partial [Desulfobulbaceae bacterium]|nr:hypothetical protein [Desulfobulbaceae bacterium]
MLPLKPLWLPLPLLLALAFFFIWLTAVRLTYQYGLALSQPSDWPGTRTALMRAAVDYGIFDKDKMTTGPWYVPATDRQRLFIAIGENYLAEALSTPETAGVFAALKNAETSFRAALRLQPLDVEAQTGLVRAMAALQRGFAWFAPGQDNPYQALPEFEKLLRLRPNGIEAHMLFIRYLNGTGQDDKRLLELVGRLAAIDPQSAYALKHDLGARRDWRDRMEPALAEGLRTAIVQNNNRAAAYRGLSHLAEGHGDMTAAVNNLLQALTLDLANSGEKPTLASDYCRLAGLYLRQNDTAVRQEPEQAASEAAIKALRLSANRDQTLRNLWSVYQETHRFRSFLNLLARVEESIRLSDSRLIFQAACLSELGNTAAAQSSLLLVKDPNHEAEAQRLLAELARRDKNWDAMELAAQRATVIEPKNSDNFYLFAQALRPQKKYPQAVEAMNRAIALATKEDPWFYDFRAWNLWDNNELEAARADWLKATQLLPDNAYFYQCL